VEETLSSKEEETVDTVTEEAPYSEGEQAVSVETDSVETEKTSAAKEEEKVSTVAEEVPSTEDENVISATAKEAPLEGKEEKEEKVEVEAGVALAVEEDSSSGVFIFGEKVESRFKKFVTAMFSIFLLPPVIVFGLSVITIVVLIAFPLISIVLPITLLSLCILFILLPVVLPLLTIIALITGKGKVQFGLENKKFAIKVLGITIPPYVSR